MKFIPIFFAIAPAILIVIYFYRKDIGKPEPKGLIIKIFFLGVFSTIPAYIIELCFQLQLLKYVYLEQLVINLIFSYFIAATVEETLKYIVIINFAYKNKNFDEVMDGIIYTITVSMGFACLENIKYVIEYDYSWNIILLRAFTSVPLHAIASGIMGYYIGISKFKKSPKEINLYKTRGLLIAIIIHGTFNMIVYTLPLISFISAVIALLPFIVATYFLLQNKIRIALQEDFINGRTIDFRLYDWHL